MDDPQQPVSIPVGDLRNFEAMQTRYNRTIEWATKHLEALLKVACECETCKSDMRHFTTVLQYLKPPKEKS